MRILTAGACFAAATLAPIPRLFVCFITRWLVDGMVACGMHMGGSDLAGVEAKIQVSQPGTQLIRKPDPIRGQV